MTLDDGTKTSVDHGSVVIAAITSCTNTSNPSVMIGAALLAKKAVEAGLERKPWVKTTLAPGSKVVMDYYERAGLTPYLEKLGFNLVGYGGTTCIGNSGPLPESISEAVAASVPPLVGAVRQPELRGSRLDVKISHPGLAAALVVVSVPAGTMDIDLDAELLGTGGSASRGSASTCGRLTEISHIVQHAVAVKMFGRDYADVFAGTTAGGVEVHSRRSPGTRVDLRAAAAVLRRDARRAQPVIDIHGARVLVLLGDFGDQRPHLAGRRSRPTAWPGST